MNNSTNGSNVSSPCVVDEQYKYIYLPVAYSICAFCGIILNGFVLWKLTLRTKKWNSTSIFMINLAVADFLYALSLMFLVHSYVNEDVWIFGDFMCRIVRFLFYFNLYGSILFLGCMSLYRYLGICHPLSTRSWHRRRVTFAICMTVWLCLLAETAPYLYFAGTLEHAGGQADCFDFVPDLTNQHLPYGIVIVLTGFLIPFVAILVFYARIIHTLRMSMRAAGSNVQAGSAINRRKAVYTIVVVLTIFVICHLPYSTTKLVYVVYDRMYGDCQAAIVSKSYKITRPFCSLNCVLNPLLYFVPRSRPRVDRPITHVETMPD
ncbi:P2Y purinoceptor 3-like [Lethenteron reissneri]|uniref:P2Y purinoceptor 3-like n=1 Tax=Lethenteron reissneri TaxID=7753 RepID=UPI002AB7A2DC|nr:P2Y purinoceptor 3-like [Lethenteron reissneri]